MEIVPGKSTETIPHATSVAEAERIESSPLPDMSEMMTRMADIGQQVKLLTENLNSILGDEEFKNSVKSMVKNIDSVGHQANQLLQRSRGLIENVEVASKNAAELSATLKGTVDKAGGDITRITGNANELLATVKTKAEGVIDNLNAGITDARGTVAEAGTTMADVRKAIGDARNAINSTVGNPEVAKNLTSAIANINSVTGLLAKRNDATEQLLLNLGDMTADLKAVSSRVREITGNIDPASVSATLNSLNGAIASMTDMVEKVKSEPVLALSINKAADRIVKMKFDEMAKQQIRGSEPVLDEINRWVREGMDKGVLNDPAYSYEVRPYAMPEVEARQAAGDRAAERRPYLND
jgi:methyl-accepting chemotaxis protein